jgi:hypothetical protein
VIGKPLKRRPGIGSKRHREETTILQNITDSNYFRIHTQIATTSGKPSVHKNKIRLSVLIEAFQVEMNGYSIQIINWYLTEGSASITKTSCLITHREDTAVHFQHYTERKHNMWTKCVDFSVKPVTRRL